MNRSSTISPVLCILLGVASALAAAPQQAAEPSDYPDAHSLALEMRRLGRLPGPPLLPPVWHVNTPDGNFAISTAPATSASSVDDAHRWLAAHAEQLDQYDQSPEKTLDAAPVLHRILAGPEYHATVSHHWWDVYRERFNAWAASLFKRFFSFIGRAPVSSGIVFWAALVGVLALLAFWLVTVLRSDATRLGLNGMGAHGTYRTGEDWMGEMARARASGDLRRAIQCAYWAAIARLQSSGALPSGAALTPREYLHHAANPADRPLRVLTTSLERFWYGGASATAADVSTCLASLKELGWRIE